MPGLKIGAMREHRRQEGAPPLPQAHGAGGRSAPAQSAAGTALQGGAGHGSGGLGFGRGVTRGGDAHLVAGDGSGWVAQPLQVRPQLFAADAGCGFDGGAVAASDRPAASAPLVDKRRVDAKALGQCRIAAGGCRSSINRRFFASHGVTVALLPRQAQEPCSIRQPQNAFSIAP